MEGQRGTRDVDDAEQRPGARVVHGGRGAVPGVLPLLEVLRREQLHRGLLREGRADRVGAHVVLGPEGTLGEPETVGLPQHARRPLAPEDGAVGVGDDDDEAGRLGDGGEDRADLVDDEGERRAVAPALDLAPREGVAGVGVRGVEADREDALPRPGDQGPDLGRGREPAHHRVVDAPQRSGVLAQVGARDHGAPGRVRRHRRLLPPGRAGGPGDSVRVARTRASRPAERARDATRCNPSRGRARGGLLSGSAGRRGPALPAKEQPMTDTLERPATEEPPAPDRADAWLAGFEAALAARDVERAAGMFATRSFWRDLVSFTWNITTVEDPDGVRDLLGETLERTDPSAFATSEPADRGRWRRHRVVHLRDRGGPGDRAGAPARGGRRGPGLDPAHHAGRAQGPRGAATGPPARGGRARRRQAPGDVEGAAPGRGGVARLDDPAVRPRHRRWAGRHRPRARGCASSG